MELKWEITLRWKLPPFLAGKVITRLHPVIPDNLYWQDLCLIEKDQVVALIVLQERIEITLRDKSENGENIEKVKDWLSQEIYHVLSLYPLLLTLN